MNPQQEIFIGGCDFSEQFHQFMADTGFDSVAPDRCSVLLRAQVFSDSVIARVRNPYKVLEQLMVLEGLPGRHNRMKGATQFKHPPLRGLWHKHFMAEGVRSMAINLRMGLKAYGLPHMQRLVAEAEESGEERYLSEEDIAAIVHDAVQGNYTRRSEAAALTGDWIVFAQHEGLNYYLCLAMHETGDQNIRDQIELVCVHEFPFLKDLLA